MGQSNKRVGKHGKVTWTAVYEDVRGIRRSAGTFPTLPKADKAWQNAEAKASEGRLTPVRRGAKKFGSFVAEWFPKHPLEDRSRENYTLYLEALIVPYFTESRMIDIVPNHVRDFVADMVAKDVPISSIEYCLVILGAIFTAALKEGIVFIHPCRGVSAPPRAKKVRQIITPEEFDDFYVQLAEERWQLLVETDIETGLRWGELTELRPKDFNFVTRRITVKRVAEELMKRFHPEGGRFKVRDYPKDKEHRQVPVSRELCRKIQKYININGIGEDDLIFEMPSVEERRAARQSLRAVPNPDTLGWTDPNEKGRTYRHGTMSAYSAGKCRCEHCRASYASYRASRRNTGKDSPRRIRAVDTDGHIPRRWFRDNVWLPARLAAGLQDGVTPHSMRHAHASWALAGGADIERVKERLGHGSILTTQKYLHTLPEEEDDSAVTAFTAIRNRSKKNGGEAEPQRRGA